ncbi:hypothetical protein TNCT_180551 [Trichonephila clavata]|uniref:Uncharacterized protein n=1 Tax=Trichonephila clavata TaxID=2740835 RepID=A0A8X6H8F4_TRICU|nr:hypothetical protein TNCT_180551 [Trichonephila clavata]
MVQGTQCSKDWSFERIRNKELVGIDHEKVLVEANTKESVKMPASITSHSNAFLLNSIINLANVASALTIDSPLQKRVLRSATLDL